MLNFDGTLWFITHQRPTEHHWFSKAEPLVSNGMPLVLKGQTIGIQWNAIGSRRPNQQILSRNGEQI